MSIIDMSLVPINQKKTKRINAIILLNECQCHHIVTVSVRYVYHYNLS